MKNKFIITLLMATFIPVLTLFSTTFSGPYVVVCPKCKFMMKDYKLTSGSTFDDDELWSDTQYDSPMLPMMPVVVKCPECQHILIIKDNYAPKDSINDDLIYELIDTRAREVSLDLEDYLQSFDLVANAYDSLLAYKRTLFAYNDSFRFDSTYVASPQKQEQFKIFAKQFIDYLDEKDAEQRLLKAELYREIGEFDTCIELISTYDFDTLSKFSNQIYTKAQEGDSSVFVFIH